MEIMAMPPRPVDVLLVDDKPANLEFLTALLERGNYTVRPALSGATALEAAGHRVPDVVLLDVCMPEMDGFEVCRRLKCESAFQHVPIIFVSALDDVLDKVRGFHAGGIDYVTKPFQIEELETRLHTHLQFEKLQREMHDRVDDLRRLEAIRERLTHITISQSGCMSHMIDDMIDIRRLEEGRMPMDPCPHDLRELIQATVTGMEEVSERCRLILPTEPALAVVDGDLMGRVLVHLLQNAVRFNDDTSVVSVWVEPSERGWRIGVEDQGIGIDRAYQEKIFERFWQAEPEDRKGELPSSGLGLTFAKLAVESLEGRIEVQSVPGEGSTFTLDLVKA